MTRSITSPDNQKAPGRSAGRRILRAVAPPAFWLGVWQLAAMWVGRAAIAEAWRAGDGGALAQAVIEGKALLLPGPVLVLRTLAELAATPLLWQSAALSLARIFSGFLGGAVLGGLLAAACAAFRPVRLLLTPAVGVIRATPVASFIILLLLWVTTGLVPAVCAGLMVLPVVWGNVYKGIVQTDPLLLEGAKTWRFGRWKTLRLVYLPSVLPYFASGCSTALGLAWKAGVAAEVLCVPKLAIGSQVYYAKLYLETPSLFAWTITVLALSFLLDRIFGALFRRMERGRGA